MRVHIVGSIGLDAVEGVFRRARADVRLGGLRHGRAARG